MGAALALAQGAGETGDFAFTPRDFERVRKLIYACAGIALSASKRSMVYSRLARRLRALRLDDFASYLDDLEARPAGDPEWQAFVNALTTNLTSFFREPHHFPVLAQHLRERAARAPLRVWCCAASTGEEPYSIVMTALDARVPVQLLATDIDTNVLATAAAGIYRAEAADKLDADVCRRHFLAGTRANAGLVRLKREVREPVEYRQLNLMDDDWPIDGRFSAIFCRNVMIYFDKPTQARVLGKLARRLEPDGLLFAGHSENFAHARHLFELQGRTVYRLAGR